MENDILDDILSVSGLSAPKSPAPPQNDKVTFHAQQSKVDPDLVRAMVGQESDGKPNAKSWAGNTGLMQVSNDVVRRFVKPQEFGTMDPSNPDVNLAAGTRYLKFLQDRYRGDYKRALAGFNAGEGNADKPDWWEKSSQWSNLKEVQQGLKPRSYKGSTREYIDRISGKYDAPLSNDDLVNGILDRSGLNSLSQISSNSPAPEASGTFDTEAIDHILKKSGLSFDDPADDPETPATNPVENLTARKSQLEADLKTANPQQRRIIQQSLAKLNTSISATQNELSTPEPYIQPDSLLPEEQADVDAVKNGTAQAQPLNLDNPFDPAKVKTLAGALPASESSPQGVVNNSTVAQLGKPVQAMSDEPKVLDDPSEQAPQQTSVSSAPPKKKKVVVEDTFVKKPTAQEVVDKQIDNHYGLEAYKKTAEIYRNITGNELNEFRVTPEQIQAAIDNSYDPKTGTLKNFTFTVNDDVADLINTFKQGGEQALKAKLKGPTDYSVLKQQYLDAGDLDAIADIKAKHDAGQATDEEVNKTIDEITSNPEYQKLIERGLTNKDINDLQGLGRKLQGYGIGTDLVGGYLGSGVGNTVDSIAGLARLLPFDTPYKTLQQISAATRLAGDTAIEGRTGVVSHLAQGLGSAYLDIPRLVALTRTPLGAIGAFSLGSGLESFGRGESGGDVARQATKGALQGALFGGASKLSELVGGTGIARKILSEGVRLATVGVGSGLIEKNYGATNKQSVDSAVQMVLFDAVMHYGGKTLNALSGKVFNVVVKNPETGQPESVITAVNEKGKPVKIDESQIKDKSKLTILVSKDVAEEAAKPIANKPFAADKPANEIRRDDQLKDLGYSESDIAQMPGELKQTVVDTGIKRDATKFLTNEEAAKQSAPAEEASTPESAAPNIKDISQDFAPQSPAPEKPSVQPALQAAENVKPAFEARRENRLKELGYTEPEIADMSGTEKQEIIDLNKPEAKVVTKNAVPETSKPVQTKDQPVTQNAPEVSAQPAEDVPVEPAKEPAQSTQPVESTSKNLTRNFRAGDNDASITFDSEAQRDLYDYYANEKKAMKDGGQRANQSRAKDLSDLKKDLAQRLNVPEENIFGMAKDVAEDVKAQMKGVGHLEERKVIDSVLPKQSAKTPIAEKGADTFLPSSTELSPKVEALEPHQMNWDEFAGVSPTLKPFGGEPYQLTGPAAELSKSERGTTGFKTINELEKWVSGKHREIVEKALDEGKTVPSEILEDYPDLAKGKQPAEKNDNVQFTLPGTQENTNADFRRQEGLLARHINRIAKSKTSDEDLVKSSKVELKDGDLMLNAPAVELFRRMLGRTTGENHPSFFGSYFPPSKAFDLAAQAFQMRRFGLKDYAAKSKMLDIERKINEASDNSHKDLVAVIDSKSSPLVTKYGHQEEKGHRADYRTRDFTKSEHSEFWKVDGYAQAVKEVAKSYPDASPSELHNEVIAKTFRDDAEQALGISREQIKKIQIAYRKNLTKIGVESDTIQKQFSQVKSQSAEEFIRDDSQSKSNGSFEKNDVAGSQQIDSSNEGVREIRREGRGFGTGSANGQSAAGGQRTGVLENSRNSDEVTNQTGAEKALFSRPTAEESDPEKVKGSFKQTANKFFSYIYDGKRDVSLPETGVNLARSGVLAAYSVVRTNLYGNTMNQISEQGSRPFAALTDILLSRLTNKTKGQRTITGLSSSAIGQGIFGERGALRKGALDSYRVLTKGMTDEELQKFDQDGVKEGSNPAFIRNTGIVPLDAAMELVKRVSGAVDKPFRAFAEETERHNAAKTIALNNKRKANAAKTEYDFKKEMRNLAKNPTEQMEERAQEYGSYATFQDKNIVSTSVEKFRRSLIDDEKLAAFAGSTGKARLLKMITYPLHMVTGWAVPFSTTPFSVWEKNLDYFPPTGALKAAYAFYRIGKGTARQEWAEKSSAHREQFLTRLDKMRGIKDKSAYAENLKEIWGNEDAQADAYFTEKEGANFARVAGHFGLGTTLSSLTILGLVYGLVDITGSDKDDDPKRKDARRAAGILPESIGIGGYRFQVLSQHSAGRTILAVTNLLEQFQRKGTATQKLTAGATQLRQDLMEGNPYGDAIFSSKFAGKDWKESLARKAAMPIPRVAEEIGETLDEKPRKVFGQGVLAPFMHKFPFLREQLPESDLTDAEMSQRDTLGKRAISTLSPVKFAKESAPSSTLPITALGSKKELLMSIANDLRARQAKGEDVSKQMSEMLQKGDINETDAGKVMEIVNRQMSDKAVELKSVTSPAKAVSIFRQASDAEKEELLPYLMEKAQNAKTEAVQKMYLRVIKPYQEKK